MNTITEKKRKKRETEKVLWYPCQAIMLHRVKNKSDHIQTCERDRYGYRETETHNKSERQRGRGTKK